MKITIDTTGHLDARSHVITIDEAIRHEGGPLDELLVRHYRTALDTKEAMVREALIQLGWTPLAEPSLVARLCAEHPGVCTPDLFDLHAAPP